MKGVVWDTYAKREDGSTMHFDILVPSDLTNEQTVFDFGMNYLKTKFIETKELTANECNFCHIERATEEMIRQIQQKGYFIIEMENCS